jgi:hypothetical protein
MWQVIVEIDDLTSAPPDYVVIGDYQLEGDAERSAVELDLNGYDGCRVARAWVAREVGA